MKNFCLLVLGLLPFLVSAQQMEGANWLFGGDAQTGVPGAHLTFSGSKPSIAPFQYDFNTGDGVASISDRNGQLLFFSTMGHISTRLQVNGKYQEMPNGNVFGSSGQTTTAELITKDPVIDSVYHIFFVTNHTNGYHDLYAAKVDMRLNNRLGDVVPNSLRLLKKKISPGIAAMLHANNRDTWIVTQNAAGDSLHAHLIEPGGINAPVNSLTNNTRIPNPFYAYTRIKGAANSELLVAKGALDREVKVYRFNRSTGAISVLHLLTISNSVNGAYSYSFSPDNSKLYVGSFFYSQSQKKSFIFQFDLTAGSTSNVQQSVYTIPVLSGANFIIDMLLALDGKIYVSRDDTIRYLSAIKCPNLAGAACGFTNEGAKIFGSPLVILPALNQTLFRNAGILQAQAHRDTICLGQSVQLSAYGAGAERFRWQLANGLTAPDDTLANPTVSPSVTTTYTVTGSSLCSSLTASVTVVVVPKPVEVSVIGPVQVYESTENQEYTIKNPNAGSTFNWQVSGGAIESGQGQSKILVNWGEVGEGQVSVTEISQTGCIGEESSLYVKILQSPEPVIYNIITPNNDGKNDFFVIENLKWYPENELQIFNRWGTEVYRSTNYQNNWQAENLSGGVYYYYFRANGKSWKGWLEVVK